MKLFGLSILVNYVKLISGTKGLFRISQWGSGGTFPKGVPVSNKVSDEE